MEMHVSLCDFVLSAWHVTCCNPLFCALPLLGFSATSGFDGFLWKHLHMNPRYMWGPTCAVHCGIVFVNAKLDAMLCLCSAFLVCIGYRCVLVLFCTSALALCISWMDGQCAMFPINTACVCFIRHAAFCSASPALWLQWTGYNRHSG